MMNSDSLVPNDELDEQQLMRINMQLNKNDPDAVSDLPAS